MERRPGGCWFGGFSQRWISGVTVLAVVMLAIVFPTSVSKAQDSSWLEWTCSYDNFAEWQSGGDGAHGQGRTICYHNLQPAFRKPFNVEVQLWLYHGMVEVAKDHVYTGFPNGPNEAVATVEGRGTQDDTWWFCAYHVCEPESGLYDDEYYSYQVPGSAYGYAPTSNRLDSYAARIYTDLLVKSEVPFLSEPIPIVNALIGLEGFTKKVTQNLRRLYLTLDVQHHQVGDFMPGFFQGIGDSRFGIVFPQKDGNIVFVLLSRNGDIWLAHDEFEYRGAFSSNWEWTRDLSDVH